MTDMSKEAIEHYEAALKEAFPSGASGDVFHHWNEARKALADQPAPGRAHYEDGDVFERIAAMKKQPAPATELREQDPVSDRENAIIRFALHQFMSNAYSNMNAAAQDKDSRHYTVGAVEKFAKDAKDAEALLSRLQFKAPQPAQQNAVAWESDRGEIYYDKEDAFRYSDGFIRPLVYGDTPQAQRKPLTLGQKQRLWSSVGDKPTLKDRVNAYGTAIEAAHGIKGDA